MANSPMIDLSQCNRFPGEPPRPIDQALDKYSHSANPEAVFDRYVDQALRHGQRELPDGELYPSQHTAAAVAAMILRAEAGMPGAGAAWKARHDRVSDVMGPIIMGMAVPLGDQTTGAGSITAVYLATNAADDAPDFSVWKTPPRVTFVDRIQAKRQGAAKNYGPAAGSAAVHWDSDHVAGQCREFLRSYLARDHGLHANTLEAILAGGYGAVVLRNGGLPRFRDTQDPVLARHLEDYISAGRRLLRGKGEGAALNELTPSFSIAYKLGGALLEQAGVEVRSTTGAVDSVRQGVRAVKGAFGTTTTRISRPAPEDPKLKEQEDLVKRGAGASRSQAYRPKPVPQKGTPAAAPTRPVSPPKSPAAGAAVEDVDEVRRRAERRINYWHRQLTHMLDGPLTDEIQQARIDPDAYPYWGRLFAAHRFRAGQQVETNEEFRFFSHNHNTIAKLALRDIERAGTLEAIEHDFDDVDEADFGSVMELRRWLSAIGKGHLHPPNGMSQESAKAKADNMTQVLAGHLRRHYNLPSDYRLNMRTMEVLAELRTLDLARGKDGATPVPSSFIQAIAQRVMDILMGAEGRDVSKSSEKNFFERVNQTLGEKNALLLPEGRARQEYLRLAKEVGWEGAFVIDEPGFFERRRKT